MDDGNEKAYRWEGDYEKTWEALKEDESGSLQASIEHELDKAKKRKLHKRKETVRLGMMRHIYIVLDMSSAMLDQDLKPNRALVSVKMIEKFLENFFDQNPIGQLGFILTRSKKSEVLSEMSGTSHHHLQAFAKLSGEIVKDAGKHCLGEPSLQNSLDLAEKTLKHMPSHTSREVIFISGSLTTCDPSPIQLTIESMKKHKIRCSVIALSAEVRVLKHLSECTGGSFGVILDESHFLDMLLDHIPPPAGMVTESSLIKMGFPPHVQSQNSGKISLSMTSKELTTGGYYCPQCQAKHAELPVQCVVCSLTLVSAPHLARSYHHLFPLPSFSEVKMFESGALQQDCFSCLQKLKQHAESVTYICSRCKAHFCIDCNLFIHETLHCCPGCINARCELNISKNDD